jgi:dUTP pyrophosphatase
MSTISIQHLSSTATTPSRCSDGAAGFDLYSSHTCTVPARGKALVKTDIAVVIPPHLYGRIAPRSGLAWKNSIDVGAGVIDSDYRGNIGVILFNHSDTDFNINIGDRIAQSIWLRHQYY